MSIQVLPGFHCMRCHKNHKEIEHGCTGRGTACPRTCEGLLKNISDPNSWEDNQTASGLKIKDIHEAAQGANFMQKFKMIMWTKYPDIRHYMSESSLDEVAMEMLDYLKK